MTDDRCLLYAVRRITYYCRTFFHMAALDMLGARGARMAELHDATTLFACSGQQ